jgi:hypothetical protein
LDIRPPIPLIAPLQLQYVLDYQPVFLGVASHERGGEMFVESEKVTEVYRSVVPNCDLIYQVALRSRRRVPDRQARRGERSLDGASRGDGRP